MCIGGGFKVGGFNKTVVASCVCVATVLSAMLLSATSSILKPPPMKQPPMQVPTYTISTHSIFNKVRAGIPQMMSARIAICRVVYYQARECLGHHMKGTPGIGIAYSVLNVG